MSAATRAIARPPVRTQPQFMAALEQANVVRLARAQVKRELSAGAITLEQAFAHEHCQTAKVSELLLAIPRVGPCRLSKILGELRVSPHKQVGGLSPRQRVALRQLVAGDPIPGLWPGEQHDVDQAPEHEASMAALLA